MRRAASANQGAFISDFLTTKKPYRTNLLINHIK